MFYFPLTPRLKRLYMSKRTVGHLALVRQHLGSGRVLRIRRTEVVMTTTPRTTLTMDTVVGLEMKNARVDPSIDEGRLRKDFLKKAAERYANFTYNQRNPGRLKKKKKDPRPFEQLKKAQFFELQEEATQNGLQVTDEEIWYSLVEGHNTNDGYPRQGPPRKVFKPSSPEEPKSPLPRSAPSTSRGTQSLVSRGNQKSFPEVGLGHLAKNLSPRLLRHEKALSRGRSHPPHEALGPFPEVGRGHLAKNLSPCLPRHEKALSRGRSHPPHEALGSFPEVGLGHLAKNLSHRLPRHQKVLPRGRPHPPRKALKSSFLEASQSPLPRLVPSTSRGT
ncbi:unnamed protein product [Cuscuta campestris]|uniref:Uncharacterized protein n=1 Tax=Cuscuta campestris TaxID=132261 RepID=A0A484KM85_9ASTE|nr:unnamed protein product [Cuscuta campestris]